MPIKAPNEQLDWIAQDFNLISTNDQFYNLNDLIDENGIVIAFICNHCPYVIKIIERFVYEASQLKNIGISTVAIMSNDVNSYPEDSFTNMKLFAKKYNFSFPYLYDESQDIAKSYTAICTPDFFGFNRNKHLKYRGRLDSGIMDENINIKRQIFYALDLIV